MTNDMPTNLDDLKLAWQELSVKLERQNALALRQVKDNQFGQFRSGLRPLTLGQFLQLIIGVAIAAFSGGFWFDHLTNPQFFVCGLLLHIYGLMFIAFAVRDLVLIRRIDYSAPVLEIQRQLAELRAWHLRAAAWHGLSGSVIWLPVMLIVLHLLGVDFLMNKPADLYWLISTAFVCLAVTYGLIFLSRSPGNCGRALRNSWIGRSVNLAQATLDEIEKFEHELG